MSIRESVTPDIENWRLPEPGEVSASLIAMCQDIAESSYRLAREWYASGDYADAIVEQETAASWSFAARVMLGIESDPREALNKWIAQAMLRLTERGF